MYKSACQCPKECIEQYFDANADSALIFLDEYKKYTGEEVANPAFTANMYSQVYLIKEAVETHGLDTDKIADAWHNLQGWESALGTLTFDENGDRQSPYVIIKITNGEAKEIAIVEPE